MCIHWWKVRKEQKDWLRRFLINGLGLSLTSIILAATVMAKFLEGGFITIALTSVLIFFCFLVKRHYQGVRKALGRLDEALVNLPLPEAEPGTQPLPPDPARPLAVIMVERYNGLGIHAIFSIRKLFGEKFKDILFVSVGRIDSSKFKGAEELENLKNSTEENLKKYVELAHKMGYNAGFRCQVGIDVLSGMEDLCEKIGKEFQDPTFFCGKLIFAKETLWSGLLHNQASMEIQRRLLFKGNNMMIIPIRVL
jgi:hypothetical protein